MAVSDPNNPADPNAAAGAFVYTYDANGNVGQLVDLTPTTWDPNDPDAVMVARYEYEPFGRLALDIGDAAAVGPYGGENPFRFSTHEADDATGLLYAKNRYYWPDLGRWITRDPIEESGGANLYAYVGNQPGARIDALGLYDEGMMWVDAMADLRSPAQVAVEVVLAGLRARHINTCYYDAIAKPILDKLEYAKGQVGIYYALQDPDALGGFKSWRGGIWFYGDWGHFGRIALFEGADSATMVHELVHAYYYVKKMYYRDPREDEAGAYIIEALLFRGLEGATALDEALQDDGCPSIAAVRAMWSNMWQDLAGVIDGVPIAFSTPDNQYIDTTGIRDFERTASDFGLDVSCDALVECYNNKLKSAGCECDTLQCEPGGDCPIGPDLPIHQTLR